MIILQILKLLSEKKIYWGDADVNEYTVEEVYKESA